MKTSSTLTFWQRLRLAFWATDVAIDEIHSCQSDDGDFVVSFVISAEQRRKLGNN